MNQKVFTRRVLITGLLFAALSLVFIIRLINLHFSGRVTVSGGDRTGNHRGTISDRNGFLLAISIEKNSLFANPAEIKNPEETARALSRFLQIPADTILKKFTKKKQFIWIKRKIDAAIADEIRKTGMPGLYFKKEYKRVYPDDALASNIVGFVGMDNNGLAGIEFAFDDILSGTKSGTGSHEDGILYGGNITLTIDRYIQHLAQKEIDKAVTTYRAQQGAVIIMETKTGRVLALAKSPGFNPNQYYEYPTFPLRNFSVTDSFEPGSTMKIISIASLLEHNAAAAGWRYTCTGGIDIADVHINCTGVHGTIGMDDIMRHSCNVGVIESMKSIKKKDLYDTLVKFGFGRKTGMDFPGETEGIVRPVDKWSGLSKYSMAIGQEISVTSLQLAAAYCAVANGGVYVAPAIIESIMDEEGNPLRAYKPSVRGRVASKKTCTALMRMMRGVVTSGTGQRAASSYYCVVGKTGTSQKFIRARGYSDRVLASFAGLAPCEDPSVCILVVIDDPADKLSGGQIATPVFANLIDRVLIQQGVKNQRLKPRDPVPVTGRLPELAGDSMPDFTGMNLYESIGVLVEMKKRHSIRYSVQGTGRVYEQSPARGAKIEKGAVVTLRFRE